MIKWALIFAVVAVIAALLGFTGIAGAAAGIAKFLFFLGVALFVLFLVLGAVGAKKALWHFRQNSFRLGFSLDMAKAPSASAGGAFPVCAGQNAFEYSARTRAPAFSASA